MRSTAPAGLAAAVVTACCCCALVYTGISGGRRATELQEEALFVWKPHQGKLTAMMDNARPARPAREQQLASADGDAADRPTLRTSGSDSAWAQQMLRMGGSYAEDNSRTNLVTPDYSNTHPGYTPMLPEGHGHGGVYDFANQISNDATSREEKQLGARTQQLAETATPAYTPAVKQVAKPGTTPDVREDRARAATKAWGWAERGQHGAKGAAGISLAFGRAAAHAESAAVTESPDTPEQKAWSWGASTFSEANRHRTEDAAMAAKTAAVKPKQQPSAATQQKQLADFAVPKKASAAPRTAARDESPRRARLAEARKAIGKLHRASLNYEHRHYQSARRQEWSRARELTRKDDDLERAANTGAAAEFNEYGAIASLGVPSGAGSAADSERDGWGRRPAQDDRARSHDFRARDPGYRRPRHARRRDGDEAEDVRDATDEIFSGLSDEGSDGDERRARRGRGARGRGGKGIETAAQIAAAEESSYQKGFDAGIAAEQKAMAEGGREDAAQKRADALKRQQRRAAARKHAQVKAQKKDAFEQKLADSTWDDADSDFQVDGGNWGPGGGDWA